VQDRAARGPVGHRRDGLDVLDWTKGGDGPVYDRDGHRRTIGAIINA